MDEKFDDYSDYPLLGGSNDKKIICDDCGQWEYESELMKFDENTDHKEPEFINAGNVYLCEDCYYKLEEEV